MNSSDGDVTVSDATVEQCTGDGVRIETKSTHQLTVRDVTVQGQCNVNEHLSAEFAGFFAKKMIN